MNEKTVVITEKDGTFQIQNNGISEFALLGILECIIFDMKSVSRRESSVEQKEALTKQNDPNPEQNEAAQKSEAVQEEIKRKAAQESTAPGIRTRVNNAVKAIRGMGGRIEDTDLSEQPPPKKAVASANGLKAKLSVL
jgi:hypothetical protein